MVGSVSGSAAGASLIIWTETLGVGVAPELKPEMENHLIPLSLGSSTAVASFTIVLFGKTGGVPALLSAIYGPTVPVPAPLTSTSAGSSATLLLLTSASPKPSKILTTACAERTFVP